MGPCCSGESATHIKRTVAVKDPKHGGETTKEPTSAAIVETSAAAVTTNAATAQSAQSSPSPSNNTPAVGSGNSSAAASGAASNAASAKNSVAVTPAVLPLPMNLATTSSNNNNNKSTNANNSATVSGAPTPAAATTQTNGGDQHAPMKSSGVVTISTPAPSPSLAQPKRRVDFFIESVVPAFVCFARNRKQSTKLLRIFLRTLGNFVHNSSTQRTTLDEARRTITAVIAERRDLFAAAAAAAAVSSSSLSSSPPFPSGAGGEHGTIDEALVDSAMEDRGSDEGMTRLLDAWTHHNASNSPCVDAESAAAMLRELDLHTSWDAVRVHMEIKKLPDVLARSSPSPASIPSSPTRSRPASSTTASATNNGNGGGKNSPSDENSFQQIVTFEHILTWYYDAYCTKEALTCFHELWRAICNQLASETASGDPSCAAQSPELRLAQWLLADGRDNSNSNGGNVNNSGHNVSSPKKDVDIASSSLTFPNGAATAAAAASGNESPPSDRAQLSSTEQGAASKEFLYRHFGGHIVEENFCSYVQSHRSNSVFDARSVSSVWHDMTQPLPNYLIRSQSVHNEMELNKALADNTRAFLMRLSFNDATGAVVVGGPESALSLKAFCEAIRDRAFKKYAFPVIICFPPWETALHSRAREERVAQILTETLGPMIAKGLMFRGATIRDPEFSPATLRHKVLIMAEQAKLNPFVGLYVADMARTGMGVRVTDVKDASPAASAGVGKDDWITRINEDVIESKQDLRDRLATLRIGEEFTVTRENLTNARVVVGSAVDTNDADHASALSNLIFFNYDPSTSPSKRGGNNNNNGSNSYSNGNGNGNGNGRSRQLYPWETTIIVTDETSSVSLETSPRPVDHLALVQNTQTTHNCADNYHHHHHQHYHHHHGGDDAHQRLSNQEQQALRRQEELALIGVEAFGAQLVDAICSRASEQWSRGTFVVNGHCGYVLRETLVSNRKSAAEWIFKIIAVPPEVSKSAAIKTVKASVFGRGEEPAAERQQQSHNNSTADDSPASARGSGAAAAAASSSSSLDSASTSNIIGTSLASPFDTVLWTLPPVRVSNHGRVAIEVVFEDNRKLEAVLPAHLLRTGLRAVPFRSLAPEGSVTEREAQELGGVEVDILCYIKKKNVDPGAVAAAEMAAVMAAKAKDDKVEHDEQQEQQHQQQQVAAVEGGEEGEESSTSSPASTASASSCTTGSTASKPSKKKTTVRR